MSQRVRQQPEGEQPLDVGRVVSTVSRPRSVQGLGDGDCLYANIPEICKDRHGIGKSDSVVVTVTSRGWFVEPVEEGHDG